MTKNHQNLLDRLLTNLEEANQLYLSLLKALESEKASLAAVNLPDFMIASEQKEALLKRLQELEARRMQQTVQLSEALGLPAQGVTLSQLAGSLGEKDASKLLERGDKLARTVARIRALNRVNRRLINGSLGFVRDSLHMLHNLKRPSPTYLRDGQMTHGACRGTILAGEI